MKKTVKVVVLLLVVSCDVCASLSVRLTILNYSSCG